MTILDWIQTICSVLGLGLSIYATTEVLKIKKTFRIDSSIKNVNQKITGNKNTQSVGNNINSKQ